MAVFSDIILQKRVLDGEGASSHVWNDRPSFRRKILWGERSFFPTKFDL